MSSADVVTPRFDRDERREHTPGTAMSEERLQKLEGGASDCIPAVAELCAEVRRLRGCIGEWRRQHELFLKERDELHARLKSFAGGESIEDATNPVCSPEAAEDARQGREDAARIGRAVVAGERRLQGLVTSAVGADEDAAVLGLTPGQSVEERLEEWRKHVQPVPSARLLTGQPSPGHEAEMARKEVAALRRELDERLAGYAAVLTRQGEKVEALESFEASVTPKVLTLEHDREQRALSATVDGRAWRALSERVSALEAGYETDRKDDELTARTRAFLVRLHGVAMPHKVCDEWKALLEAWGE